jgi:pimeloyl-ACP methyl ester carboxylesterase
MVIKILAGLFILYAMYCGALYVKQRQILFPKHLLQPVDDAARHIPNLEKRFLDLPFGKVETWFLPPSGKTAAGPAPAVIFAHGNGELIDDWPRELVPLTRMGIGVLLVEYPGYGRSEGEPTERTVRQTLEAAYDAVVRRPDVAPDRIILLGRSLGGGAVCTITDTRPSAALILMSTFTGVKGMAAKFYAPPFLIRDPFDNLSAVSRYKGPILIVHGSHDNVVPYSHGKRLHRAASGSTLITYESGHNDCPPDWADFWNSIEGFLKKNGVVPPQAGDDK